MPQRCRPAPWNCASEFGALERLLTRQTGYNFAYEKPQVHSKNGTLRIRVKFSGRSWWRMFGQCVGLGDAFDVVIAATPQCRDGALRLQGVEVASDHKTSY